MITLDITWTPPACRLMEQEGRKVAMFAVPVEILCPPLEQRSEKGRVRYHGSLAEKGDIEARRARLQARLSPKKLGRLLQEEDALPTARWNSYHQEAQCPGCGQHSSAWKKDQVIKCMGCKQLFKTV